MIKKEKNNLILVNSFYTNSSLLNEFINFLEDYFHVYFIDMPGFIETVPALSTISLENYSRYVQEKIDSYNLESYIVGGISFGFLIANNVPLDKNKCKGILAIVPFINSKSLKLRKVKKISYSLLVKIIVGLNVSGPLWKSRHFKWFARLYSSYPRERVDIILSQMDGRTYFETGKLILENHCVCDFQDFPTVLILSENDNTIANEYMTELFSANVDKLMIVRTDIEHYPLEISKAYFQERFPKYDIERIIQFFHSYEL